jgi:hypothetical protein
MGYEKGTKAAATLPVADGPRCRVRDQGEDHDRHGCSEPTARDCAGGRGQQPVRCRGPGAQPGRGQEPARAEQGGEPGERDRAEQQDVDGERRVAEEQGRDDGEHREIGRGQLVAAEPHVVPGSGVGPP